MKGVEEKGRFDNTKSIVKPPFVHHTLQIFWTSNLLFVTLLWLEWFILKWILVVKYKLTDLVHLIRFLFRLPEPNTSKFIYERFNSFITFFLSPQKYALAYM